MERKPDIQYVGQFYIHGSEARELARKEQEKQARTRLPLERLQNIQKVYLDPVALMGIVVSVVMLVVMIVGAVQISRAWATYEQMSVQLAALQRENDVLEHGYRSGYDLEEIRIQAEAMGMITVAVVLAGTSIFHTRSPFSILQSELSLPTRAVTEALAESSPLSIPGRKVLVV